MKNLGFAVLVAAVFFSCDHKTTNRNTFQKSGKTDAHVSSPLDSVRERIGIINSQLINPVDLYELFDKLLRPQEVKLITELKEGNPEADGSTTWSSSKFPEYSFNVKMISNGPYPDADSANTVLSYGNKKLSFDEYRITGYEDSIYQLNEYGFNRNNHLRSSPKVIEVCGLKFLYSDIGFACNGIGCSCRITMIYDLQTNKATFIENFGISIDGFYLSDFNTDNIPDLLVIAQADERLTAFGLDGLKLKLIRFQYADGIFKEVADSYMDLYAVGDPAWIPTTKVSVVHDHWFR